MEDINNDAAIQWCDAHDIPSKITWQPSWDAYCIPTCFNVTLTTSDDWDYILYLQGDLSREICKRLQDCLQTFFVTLKPREISGDGVASFTFHFYSTPS